MTDPLISKVCIIDDDKLYVSLITMLINQNHFAREIIVFANGQEALEYFKNNIDNDEELLPEIILLDLNMPIMNGWEFLEHIEPYANKLLANDVRLNVVSSTINPEEVDRAENHGIVNLFMNKPISKEAIALAFTK
ncbi:response regulator [Nonlabens antarcticus]|uniref:response regulator n=1 Tax=Nonlabens antarcticus TaxID=392714 RepID=UPI001891C124|nr:response regulator [Nonlabens antarcticus]